jgi:hypothetical protein
MVAAGSRYTAVGCCGFDLMVSAGHRGMALRPSMLACGVVEGAVLSSRPRKMSEVMRRVAMMRFVLMKECRCMALM